MRADRGAGGLASAGGSGSSIKSDWISVEAEVAAVAAAGARSPDEGDVPNTVDYNGEVGRKRRIGSGVAVIFVGARDVS